MSQKKLLLFATNNQHKVEEIKKVVGGKLRIISLLEAGITVDIPEPHPTLEANAREKSTTLYRLTGQNCMGEDTGLEVPALQGEPGVKSARYAGEGRDFAENIDKLLNKLNGIADRTARFRTVISLIWNGKEYQFTGICPGKITEKRQGEKGFGYDGVFVPDGAQKTFAEMELSEKNLFSHRRKATDQLLAFLRNPPEN